MASQTWSVKLSDDDKEKLIGTIKESGIETSKDFIMHLLQLHEIDKAKQSKNLIGQDIDELQKLTNRINCICQVNFDPFII